MPVFAAQNSDPTIAFGFGGAKPNFSAVVYALLLCGSSRSQYIGLFSFTFYHYLIGAYPDPPYVKGNLTYLGKTAVSPATHGPRRQPATVRMLPVCVVEQWKHPRAVFRHHGRCIGYASGGSSSAHVP